MRPRPLSRLLRPSVSGVVAAGLLVAGVPLAAAPASAVTGAATIAINVAPTVALNGSLALGATVTGNDPTQTPTGSVEWYAGGAPIASASVSTCGTTVPYNCTASGSWNPTTPGAYALTATYVPPAGSPYAGAQSAPAQVLVQIPTQTVLSAPTSTPVNSPVTLTATVTNATGFASQPPPGGGTVTFMTVSPVVLIATVPLVGNQATISWTPTAVGQVSLEANYNDTSDPLHTSSNSSVDKVTVTRAGDGVTLSAPATVPVNSTVTLTATVSPSTATGTITFRAGTTQLGQPVTIANGSASIAWTPKSVGQVVVGAKYSGDASFTQNDVTANVSVVRPVSDTITVDPAGQAPWTPGQTETVTYGTAVNLVTSAQSGMPVTLTAVGSCTVTGSPNSYILTAQTGSGTCTLTASTKPSNSFTGATQTYPIALALGTQTANVKAPPSGNLASGSKYTLGSTSLRTSAGQEVEWQVKSGAARCRIVQKPKKYVLRTTGRGSCKVLATADAVSGHWKAYKLVLKYSIG